MSGYGQAFRFLSGGTNLVLRTLWGTGKAAARGAQRAHLSGQIRASAAVGNKGYLAPGDPPVAPGAMGLLDYRGVAGARDIRMLSRMSTAHGWPIGTHIALSAFGRSSTLAIPRDVLARHIAVVGPTTAGKTYGLLVPWIHAALRAGDSVVALDVKGDLLTEIEAFAARHGGSGARAAKWDFADPTQSINWSWLAELDSEDAVDAAVTAILGKERTNSTADPFFHRRDALILRGLLTYTARCRLAPADVKGVIELLTDRRRLRDLVRTSSHLPGMDDLGAAQIANLDSLDYGKAIQGVSTALGRIDSAAIRAVTLGKSMVSIRDIAQQPTLLVVGARLSGGDRSVMLSSLFLNLFTNYTYKQFGGSGVRRTYLVLDEAARIANRFQFEEVLSVARAAGLSLVLAVQAPEQFTNSDERAAIFNNCATLILFPGSSASSAAMLTDRLGTHTVTTVTTSHGSGPSGPSVTKSFEVVPVLRPAETMAPPFGNRPVTVHIKASDLGVTAKPFVTDILDNH